VRQLREAGCVAAEEEAGELLATASGPEQLASMLSRRLDGEPLAWVVGSTEFCGVRVFVHPGVYVPRWQSEPLVRRAAELLATEGRVVDLCTGSGALALALERLTPLAEIVATEIDPVAVACARANGVRVYEGDLDDALPREFFGTCDLVLGVVPYVPSAEIAFLPRDFRDYEPLLALDGGPDGAAVLMRAVAAASRLLKDGGTVLLELGGSEDEVIVPLLGAEGFVTIRTFVDDDGDLRALEAVRRRM
jgi:release factor glutamine methyltransferase